MTRVLHCLCLHILSSVLSAGCRSNPGDDSRLAELETRFEALVTHVGELEQRERRNAGEIGRLQAELRAQQRRTETLERLVQAQRGWGDGGEFIGNRSEEGTTGVPGYPLGRRQTSPRTVAFYTTLTTNLVHNGAGQNIRFDHVITNAGSAYDPVAGTFIAPVPGLYVFSVWLTAYVAETERYVLVKNHQHIVASMFARAQESPFTVTGQTAILQLDKGDAIEIQTQDPDGSVLGSHYSSFAGFLLQEDLGGSVAVGK